MRRMLVALMLGALLAMLIAGGVAFAKDVNCADGQAVDGGYWCTGTADKDTLTGTPVQDRMEAGAGNDHLYGLGDIDSLYGQGDNDTIHGDATAAGAIANGANWDALYGGSGRDTLYGEAGDDILYAGDDRKHDTLDGGEGDDVYVVDKAAYEAGLQDPTATNADVIEGDANLGPGVQLTDSDSLKPLDLRARVAQEGRLYFYP